MPIPKIPKQVKASNSTHGGNGSDVSVPDADQDLENHMLPTDLLIDPEDLSSGSTHTSVTASKKVVAADQTTNISTIDNDEDPTAGYLETAEIEDEDPFDDEGIEENADELVNNNGATELVAGDEDADWDAPAEDDDAEDDEADIDDEDHTEAEDGDIAGDEVDAEAEEEEPVIADEDAIDLVDVDGVDDGATDDVAFAVSGTRLMAIKGSRIIAHMGAKAATAFGKHDVYLSDQFQQVTASEMQARGLRKGLKAMGFTMAKVSLAKATVVKAQVAKEVQKVTAATRQVQAAHRQAFEQSLAIAAVGLNRRFFNDAANPLKDFLHSELTRAGVRNAGRILQAAFAEHGPAYAKSIVELATKISAMPQESRDGFVSALDLTSPDVEDVAEDVVPIGADDDSADDDVDFATDSVETTLATAGVRKQVIANRGQYSVAASAALNGNEPLFSL